jgi:dipeptidyl aminopeptidase/acylaminoacyl peptidase
MLFGGSGPFAGRCLAVFPKLPAVSWPGKNEDEMKRRNRLSAGLFVAALLTCAEAACWPQGVAADDAKPAAKKEPWKPEDFIFNETASQYRISPDGKWLVWVKSTGDKDKDLRVSNLVLSSLTEDREVPLTRGTDNNNQPRWSPDGEKIAFVSTRARPKPKPDSAPGQIWLIDSRGGEPWPVTDLMHSPKQVEWLDKDTLIYSASEDPALYEQELKKKKDDSEVIDDADHEPPVRLYKLSVKDKKITRLTSNTDWIENFSVSRDAKYVVASHARSLHYNFDHKARPIVILHDLSGGPEKQIFADLRIRPEALEWASDNSGFYMATPFSTDARFLTAGINIAYFYDMASGKGQQVNLDWENGLGFDLQTVPGGFLALLLAGNHQEIAFYAATKDASGWTWRRQTLGGDHAKNLEGFRAGEDGKIVYSYSTASKLPQLYRAQVDNGKLTSPVQVSKLNEGLVSGRAYAKSEVIRWKGSNDETVEGILYYPTNYEEGKSIR